MKTKATGEVAADLIVYAGGSSLGNPGPMGIGVVLIDGDSQVEISESLGHGTNNVAELLAIFRGVTLITARRRALVCTDSQYAIGVLQGGKRAKVNREVVAQVRALLDRLPLARLQYVPGHAGVALNERADELARWAASTGRSYRQQHARR